MRELIPDIDYKAAGLTDADLSMIGVDFMLQTEGENSLASELNNLMTPILDEREAAKAQRAAAREEEHAMQSGSSSPSSANGIMEDPFADQRPTPEEEWQSKIDAVKQLKKEVKEKAIEQARNNDAYVVLSFSDWNAKAQFCQRFGFSPYDKFIKGELFDEMVERIEM